MFQDLEQFRRGSRLWWRVG